MNSNPKATGKILYLRERKVKGRRKKRRGKGTFRLA
jgi:hypothetical protein